VSTDYRDRLYAEYRSSQARDDLDDRLARAPYLRRVVRRHFPPDLGVCILDLGCGSGTLLHFLREAGYRQCSGVDRSAQQVEAAGRAGIEGVEQGELGERLARTASGSVDVVVTWDVIEHLRKDELLAFADEVRRVLRDGGRWVLHVPNAESHFGSRIRYADYTHELAFTRESLAQLVRAAGFGRIDCFEDEPAVHGLPSLCRWLLWRAIRACLLLCVFAETGDVSWKPVFSQNLLAVVHRG
jgi:2-polyprenyl-3-methyl-5-hydroxy-6-metoxy-1,4-benzoquinol methylase